MRVRRDLAAALAAGSLHELRNLLAVAESALYLARTADPDAPPLDKQLVKAERSIRAAQDLLGRLLDVARGAPLSAEPVEATRVIEEALAGLVIPDNVRVDVAVDPGSLRIACDLVLLPRVVANLVMNALEAMPGGGNVTVDCRKVAPSGVEIVVSDDGPGLDEARLWSGTSTKPHGLGMGLAVARAIVESHGGTLSYRSGGKGATFVVELP